MNTAHKHTDGGHEHKAAPMVEEITDYEVLEIAVRELAIEHGLFSAEDHRRFTEWAESVGPAAGSRLVAKAWTDPTFKARLLENGTEVSKEIGIDWAEPTGFGTPSDYTNFRVLEDTPTLHHVIVCTLCSCYPRPMLGMSPEWYRSTNYRRRLVRWPREVLAEFGCTILKEAEQHVGSKYVDQVLDCLYVIETGMQHFFIRAEMGKSAGREAEEVDEDYKQAAALAALVAPYRHARLSATKILGDPNNPVHFRDDATADELRAEIMKRLEILTSAGLIDLKALPVPGGGIAN